MNIFRSRFLLVAGLAGAAGLLVNVNCSSGGGGGTGGTTGTGGTSSTGGKSGTGGTGTGGSSSTGGAGGHATGGAGGAATGGAGGNATGGSGGAAGGNAGAAGGAAGGSTGVGGAIAGTALATFDPTDAGATAALEGFVLDKTANAGNLALATDAEPAATLAWDGTEGDPADGSLKIDAPFHAYNESVNLQKGYANT